VLSLIISAALGSKSLWDEGWFVALLVVLTGLTALGLYMLAAVYFRLPLPETRASRETRAELRFGVLRLSAKGPRCFVAEVPLTIGRVDIENASINVVVPDFLKIEMSTRSGVPAPQLLGGMDHTSESLYDDNRCQSNFWQQTLMKFPAFTNQALYFLLCSEPLPTEPFPFRFDLSAASLHGGVRKEVAFDPATYEDNTGVPGVERDRDSKHGA
jgi:hypothetical protein